MKQPAKISIAGIVAAVLAAILYPRLNGDPEAPGTTPPAVTEPAPAAPDATNAPNARPKAPPPAVAPNTGNQPATAPPAATKSRVGFTSRQSWLDHFDKHGHEFGDITADEYLARAQALRDAPVSDTVLEAVRAKDGVITRFDRKSKAFLAFHKDKSIRTFFRPNDGEAYFKRQLDRSPQDDR